MKQTQTGKLEGILKRHPDGFGFVIPDDKNHPDIYIPSAKIGSALTNDRVEVLVYQKRKGGSRSYFGFIKNILKRDKKFVVGVFEANKGQARLINHNLAFFEAIPLANPKKIPVKKGDYIKAKIKFQNVSSFKRKSRFLKQDSFFKAELSENLGCISSSAKDDVRRVMAECDIPFEFPSSVLKEVGQLPDNVREKDYSDRKDLRQKAFVTIDGATAQDFDDAVFVERHKDFYRLYVAIADVSYYVREDSELDKSAFERGNSSYFPNFCSPMLPEKLSNDLCSLKERQNRLVMAQEMDFDFQGEMRRSQLYPSVIKSHKRLTYGQVQETLDQLSTDQESSQSHSASKSAYLKSLKQAQGLAQILIKRHIKELGFDLDIPETLILVDPQGEPQDILRERRLFSHKMIEQFMLSANKAVSAFLERKQMPLMYRIHESPDSEKLKILQKFSKTLGFSKSFQSRKNFIQFLDQHKNHEKSALIHKLTLRSLPQARYSAFNKGHYGLNFQSYTHFTSPIRRYCDLKIHRFIKQALAGESISNKAKSYFTKELEKQAGFISAREQNSVQAERKIKDIKSARFLKKYVGENLIGSISSVTNFGLFIALKTFFVEGLVRYQDMEGFWEADEFQLYARNKTSGYLIQLGDEVEVLVTASHIQTGQVDLRLLSHKGKEFTPHKTL
ncbi:MAG: ribonuclease R [Oligoflexia bacterium]|nr:ribonuclease R [Oligoflexia bacterium]